MKNKTVRTIAIAAAVVFLVAIVGLGAAVWLFTRSFSLTQVDESSALARFDEVRGSFAGVTPVIQIQDGRATLTRRPPAQRQAARLSTLHVVAWDPQDRGLARIDLPFALLRLKSGPIEIASEAGFDGDLNLTVEDLERYGSTLVLAHTGPDGERVLVWTQ